MIKIENLNLSFGENHILKDVSIYCEKGKSLVIIGTSGAGKSTILKCICGLLKPQSGKIIIDGQDILRMNRKELEKVRHKTGMVFQYSALFDYLSVYDNVAFGLRKNTKKSEEEIEKICMEKLSLLNLAHTKDKFPDELSGGMKKRVALARTLVMEPAIILYDEPTSGLDPITTGATNNLINFGKNELGMTSVVVSHDLLTINNVADYVAFIHEGQIIFSGTYKELINSDNPYVVQFMNGKTDGPIKTIG
ncbi:MAG: ABC transporter ATP-binding protein [Armatimonadetes bacterium]|nr:ABC transporter ATP-binding protein [Candidatus Hippobium faecium]